MLFLYLHFEVIFILVPTFLFYHFRPLIQLTLISLVLSVSQQTEIADMANRMIKILIKIHRGFRHPCHMGFPPLYSYVSLTTPQINIRNPKLSKFKLRPPPTTNPHLPKPRSKHTIETQWKQAVQQVPV